MLGRNPKAESSKKSMNLQLGVGYLIFIFERKNKG
jgi:hypothetical protein